MSEDTGNDWQSAVYDEIAEGMSHEKCYACQCMHDGVARVEGIFEETDARQSFLDDVREWQDELDEVAVDCRGCPHCFPAEATNIATDGVDDVSLIDVDDSPLADARSGDEQPAGRQSTRTEWPPIPGDYEAMCTGSECPVAVSTLGDGELADELVTEAPDQLCIVGETRTENTGVEKLLKNVIANPTIEVLVLAGPDVDGHRSGKTMKALLDSGVTAENQIVDAPGPRPVLANTTQAEIEAFREQVEIVDMIGCTDVETILETVVAEARTACTCDDCSTAPAAITDVPRIEAAPDEPVRMDPAGYFVVIPDHETGKIICEQYEYDHSHRRTIEGDSADDIYREIIEREFVSRLDHAAYLGAELTKAQLALSEGFDFEQGGKPE